MDEGLAAAVREGGWHEADRRGLLDGRDRAMLGYVEKLTLRPYAVTREDLDALRAEGFDDTGILQVNLIASFFNYINRVADGLGVGQE